MKLLLYCTKAKPILRDYRGKAIYDRFVISPTDRPFTSDDKQPVLNGKIVAECDFEVEEIEKGYGTHHASFDEEGYFDDYYDYMTKTIDEDILLKRSCLNIEELETYNPKYAIHIKNLHIFDKPKELEEVYKIDNVGGKLFTHSLKKAPQNMMHVSANRWVYDFYEPNDINILISIKPEWLCKILNGEKTIEVRKKVLKEMK